MKELKSEKIVDIFYRRKERVEANISLSLFSRFKEQKILPFSIETR